MRISSFLIIALLLAGCSAAKAPLLDDEKIELSCSCLPKERYEKFEPLAYLPDKVFIDISQSLAFCVDNGLLEDFPKGEMDSAEGCLCNGKPIEPGVVMSEDSLIRAIEALDLCEARYRIRNES